VLIIFAETLNISRVCVAVKMSSGRSVGSLEMWCPDDQSFNKHILQEGHGELTPNDESVCIVHVVSIGMLLCLLEMGKNPQFWVRVRFVSLVIRVWFCSGSEYL